MTLITDIPCELIAAILRSLDDLRSLTPALLSCRHIYSSYKQSPNIAAAILRQKVTPALLPCAVAASEAYSLPRPRDGDTIQGLLDALYQEPLSLANRVTSLPMTTLMGMSRTHDMILALTTEFANDAWDRLRQADDSLPLTASLSTTEQFRFCRSFYRIEIFYGLFTGRSSNPNTIFEESVNSWFFSKHPLWENEQLGCIHDFLEARLAKASIDVLAHDVNFGEFSVDYLTGGEENIYRQMWLSKGIGFIHQLINEEFYDGKRDMLTEHPNIGVANFPGALTNVLGAYQGANAFVGREEELLYENVSRVTAEDSDQGPFNSWNAAHEGAPLCAGLMLHEHELLRDCAYVLWDWDRVEKHHLLKAFENLSDARPSPDEKEYDEMNESFHERSQIWQKGGSGYWSKGDTSGISWSEKSTARQF
ncbi:hypothetical protein CGCF413_v014070 [Colletotrichum fructicola]|nr:hypothetical protein CGCF413_v014070 [Colletotrichum fructicola]